MSFEKLGDVAVKQQNFPNAERYYRDGLKIAERLTQSDPMHAGWQRDLAVSHFRLFQFAQEKGNEAMAATELHASYTVLHGMKQRGLHFDPPIAGVYEQLHAMFGGET